MGSRKEIVINDFNSLWFTDKPNTVILNSEKLEKNDLEEIEKTVTKFKIIQVNLKGKTDIEALCLLCKFHRNIKTIGLFNKFFKYFYDKNISFPECFKNIKRLILFPYSGISSTKTIIDLTVFENLEEISIDYYWSGAESVFKITSLRKIFIWGYPYKDFSPFRELVNLEHIELNQPSIRNFKGAPGLKKLKEIEIHYAMGLKSLDGIEHFENLESILISASGGPKDLSPIKKLKKIRWLGIDKTPTLKPLEGHESLEAVHIDRVEDRDLSTLFKIPKLKGYVVDRNFENKLPYTEHEINTYVKFYKFKK